jgi:hypothetical protein
MAEKQDGNRSMAEEKIWTDIMMRLLEPYLLEELVSVLKEESRNFIFIFLFKKAA